MNNSYNRLCTELNIRIVKKPVLSLRDLSLDELKTLVYELGIDDAYENPSITKQDLIDLYYDYKDNN